MGLRVAVEQQQWRAFAADHAMNDESVFHLDIEFAKSIEHWFGLVIGLSSSLSLV
jgi:hypothetical protein